MYILRESHMQGKSAAVVLSPALKSFKMSSLFNEEFLNASVLEGVHSQYAKIDDGLHGRSTKRSLSDFKQFSQFG